MIVCVHHHFQKLFVFVCVCRLWVIVTSSTPLKVYLFDGGVVIFGSVLKQLSAVDLPANDEVSSCRYVVLHGKHVCYAVDHLLRMTSAHYSAV